MNKDIPRGFEMPYLEAIQKIPGDIASEKFSWIGKLASDEPNAIENHEKLSPELLPLLRVEVAVKHKRHEDITSALISNVSPIVSRALKASWFFDGRHEIVDVAYFCKRIFPFASLRTRNRILKTLSRRIQNSVFAQEMFTAVASTYNTETALPLILACNETFIFETLLRVNRLPSVKIVKKLFFKNRIFAQFLFQYFVYYYYYYYSISVSELSNVIKKYIHFVPKVAKNCPFFLVHIMNLNLIDPLQMFMMSNTCAKSFLQRALQYVTNKPELYYRIIPHKIFNAVLARKFPDLVNNPMLHEFYRKELLQTLMISFEDRNLELCLKTYRKICNGELVDINDVTPLVLRLLPAKKRMQLARDKINCNFRTINCVSAWICYFPAKKATSVLKLKLNRATGLRKFCYIAEMIYACEVNNDENELYNTLKYIIDKGYIVSDNVAIYEEGLSIITNICKPIYLNKRNGFLLYRIIQMFYEKYNYVNQEILCNMILHRLIYQKSIEDLLEMLLKTNDNHAPIYYVNFIPAAYMQYYRQFLVIFLNLIQQKYAISWEEKLQQEIEEQTGKQQRQKFERRKNHSRNEQGDMREDNRNRKIAFIRKERSNNNKIYLLCWLISGMYHVRDCEREKTSKGRKERKIYEPYELMSIRKYPWIMNAIYTIMHLKNFPNFPGRQIVRNYLHKYEPELYHSWFLPNTSKNIENVISGAALRLLKQDSQSVLDNWEEYLIDCKRHYRYKHVQRFVRATLWYKDIPVKFAERCISDLHGEDTKEMSSALIILSLLLDGNSLTELINPLILAHLETTMDKHKFVRVLHFIIKFSDLPEFL